MINEFWRISGRKNQDIMEAMDSLPPVEEWNPVEKSNVWFSKYHFGGNQAFELPFHPDQFVYSPVVKTRPSLNTCGKYERGVKKYQNMIQKNQALPPITYVWDIRTKTWSLQDGCHRTHAACLEGVGQVLTVFAYPMQA